MVVEQWAVLGTDLPIRNVEIGSTFSVADVTPHSFMIKGMALLGSELAIVEFITVVMVVNRMKAFLLCNKIRLQAERASQQRTGWSYLAPIVWVARICRLPGNHILSALVRGCAILVT